MRQSELLRWGGFLGMIGAVLLIIGAVLHPPVENPQTIITSNWVWAHIIMGKSTILGIIGLTAIYYKMTEKIGWLGLLGYLLSIAGLAGFMFIVYFAAIVEPVLARQAPALLDMNGPLLQGLLGVFFLVTILSFVAGFLLFGIKVWQTNKIRWIGVLLVIGSLPFLYYFINPEAPELIYNIALIALAVGLFGLNRQVWTDKSQGEIKAN